MSAPIQTRSTRRYTAHTPGGAETRLRWWGLILPALAFTALLLLLSGPGAAQAHAATGGATGLAGLFEQFLRILS
ncbi:hypothetical protein [Streptomyces sp. NPDC089919]|uniref:hypothetical protein n=1 Tax=Streptomyces sp. NPDC089919 TaxID=3155188 RepID=UPI003434021C